MKSSLIHRCLTSAILLILAFLTPGIHAAEGDSTESGDGENPASSFTRLPRPLDLISTNILDFERSGHFEILSAKIGRTRQFEDEAVIWTVQVLRPITCAHAQILLRRMTDARFYRIAKDAPWRKQVLMTHLYYPNWLDSGAANRESLNQDEQFEIWIPLTAAEVDRLQQEQTNTLIFSHADWRTVLPGTSKRSKPPTSRDSP